MHHQDEKLLTTFPTPRPESTESLFKQLHHFHRPSGGKRTGPLPAPVDLTSPGTDTPDTSVLDTPVADDEDEEMGEEPPRKRSRRNGTADEDGHGHGNEHDKEEHSGTRTSPRHGHGHGKKPGKGAPGKKGTKPRTVVRGARGLVPMETDPDGSQHVGGHLPDSAVQGENGAEEDEDEDEDVPLAQQRPQLEEGERLRREMIKEKEREREEEVMRRVAEEDGEGLSKEDAEIWEGVELVRDLPRSSRRASALRNSTC
jgi:histone acetyltransferase